MDHGNFMKENWDHGRVWQVIGKYDFQNFTYFLGESDFSASSTQNYIDKIKVDQEAFFALEIWRRAGYIGINYFILK